MEKKESEILIENIIEVAISAMAKAEALAAILIEKGVRQDEIEFLTQKYTDEFKEELKNR